ncbi:MAG TPA: TraR/DksA C4-type zinc finger protein [Hanamia sp.]|nr:TraR/DksA C4-type zinc finger protein [Hanamia sp.]
MATKKKATTVASKSKAGKTAAKKSAVAKKTGGKTTVTKKAAPKKVIAKKASASKVTSKTKKTVKSVPAKKAASKLNKDKKSPVTQKKSPAKKTAKIETKKAAPKKLAVKKPVVNIKKNTSKKEKISEKKSAPVNKKQEVNPIKQKSSEKAASKAIANNHKAELKKAIAKVKVQKEEKNPKKAFVMPKTNTEKARKYEPEFTKSVLDQTPAENNGPSMRYSDSELVEFRELITRKLETAKKELGYLQGLITRKDQMGGDESDNRYMTMEDGSLSMEREQLSQMASRQITFIDHLEKAMMRIENKTYGICRVTGKLIDKARLRAVPHATLSIEAKMGTSR